MSTKKNNEKRGVGRPRYEPTIPEGRFTFNQLAEANGVRLETGQGPNCSALTLRKFIGRDKARQGRSVLVQLKGIYAPSVHEKHLGRRQYLFAKRGTEAATVSKEEIQKAKGLTETPPVSNTGKSAKTGKSTKSGKTGKSGKTSKRSSKKKTSQKSPSSTNPVATNPDVSVDIGTNPGISPETQDYERMKANICS